MGSANIIDSSAPEIVLKETKIVLSDEKLRWIILSTYERAQKDSKRAKYHELCSSFFSAAITLLLTLFTSSFKAIGPLSSQTITWIAASICGICAIGGFIFLGMHLAGKNSFSVNDRDNAVQQILDDNLQSNKKPGEA